MGGTNALMEYNYLVKKVVFKISVLPIVKMISALFVHAFSLCFHWFYAACMAIRRRWQHCRSFIIRSAHLCLHWGWYMRPVRSLYSPGSDTDHQYFLSRYLADTNHVGCQHAGKLSVADQTVQIESDVLYCHRIP